MCRWPQQMVYSSSVDIRPEWAVVEQIPFTALAKLHYRFIFISLRATAFVQRPVIPRCQECGLLGRL